MITYSPAEILSTGAGANTSIRHHVVADVSAQERRGLRGSESDEDARGNNRELHFAGWVYDSNKALEQSKQKLGDQRCSVED